MRPFQSLFMKISKMGVVRVLSQPATRQAIGNKLCQSQERPFAQNAEHLRRKASTLQSMREFFMHPLTWDRNNGYLNVLLALIIFSFCFINACSPCPGDMPQRQQKKAE